jgi:hypothetical protein
VPKNPSEYGSSNGSAESDELDAEPASLWPDPDEALVDLVRRVFAGMVADEETVPAVDGSSGGSQGWSDVA